MAVGQNEWYRFGVGAPSILVYFRDWHVHGGYGILTHGRGAEEQHVQASHKRIYTISTGRAQSGFCDFLPRADREQAEGFDFHSFMNFVTTLGGCSESMEWRVPDVLHHTHRKLANIVSLQ